MASLPPGSIILLGALFVPLLQGRMRQVWLVGLPLVSLLHLLWFQPAGHTSEWEMFGQALTPVRVDKLSLVWGYVFHIAAVLGFIFAWHVKDRLQHTMALIYIAASIGAVFAGDLLTLFIYWELTAIASVFIVWSGGSQQAYRAGMRYFVMHVSSGLLVLSGALLIFSEDGSLSFGDPNELGLFHGLESWGAKLLLIGFGIKAAFPLLHCWLPDAYPQSTVTGTVFLSAFTTKMAIYALVRGFAGCEWLISVGVIMVLFPLAYALLADDMRQTLAHVLNNQLGFMVVAAGIGTDLAINGAAAQAFAHVIYKGLLFMAMGAVLYRCGTIRQSELGGLARSMPWTCACCIVGALSVLPLNCGFVTKALVLAAVAEEHLTGVWLVLILGSVGALLTAGIKVPYFTFFGREHAGGSVEEAPRNMLLAMGISAALCLLMGIAPRLLYQVLPFPVEEPIYTFSHVVTQMQLVLCTMLAFAVLVRFGGYPPPARGELLDVDWIYRKPLPHIIAKLRAATSRLDLSGHFASLRSGLGSQLSKQCGEAGMFGRSVSTNAMAISAMILLAIYLLAYYR